MIVHEHVDEPTHRVVWETIDDTTIRVKFEEIAADASDGIPAPIEPETSQTVAVTLVDLDEAIAALLELARRDRIPMTAFGVRVDERTPVGQFRALRLCISDWWRFRQWFARGLREAEQLWFRRFTNRKATAIAYRMRLFAEVVAREMPPQNYTVLCLE